jgi:uncharacterized protein YdgA (DUF945 family)
MIYLVGLLAVCLVVAAVWVGYGWYAGRHLCERCDRPMTKLQRIFASQN